MKIRALLAVLSTAILLSACGGYDPDDPEAPEVYDYEYPTGEAYTDEQAGGGQPGEGAPWHECMNADCNMPEMRGDEVIISPLPWEAPKPNFAVEKTLPR